MRKVFLVIFFIAASLFIWKINSASVLACTGGTGSCSGTCGNIGLKCENQGSGCGCYNTGCGGCSGSAGTCPNGGSQICNYSTCRWACNDAAPGCTQWSGWSGCSGGYQQRECQAGSGATQQRTCTNPTNPPNTGSPNPPTDTPVPPTATPTPFIRTRIFNPELTPVVESSTLCKANCSTGPCTYSGCQAGVNLVDVGGAVAANEGGAFRDPTLVVIGVTPATNGAVDNSGTYSNTCRGSGAGNYCYYWPTNLTTGSRTVRYIVATPTPTATPTPGPWVKLKDSSYVSRNSMTDRIPVAPVAYDAADTNQPYFIVGEAGVVAAPDVNMTAVNVNAKTGNPEYKANYTPAPSSMTASTYMEYAKARKQYKTISAMTDINENGLYIFQGNLNLASVPAQFNQYNVVIVASGTITIDTASFVPTKSIVLMGTAIDFTATVTEARGIFIANSVNTGTTVNQGLKITGNIISQSALTNSRRWADPNKVPLFVVFDPSIYIQVLPYLSTANYEWKQLQ